MTKHRNPQKSSKKQKPKKQNSPWLWIGLGCIAILILGAIVLVTKSNPSESLPAEISASQAYTKFQQGSFFLDVRSQAEWDQAHIPNSTLIPLDELDARTGELPRDQDIVVVCQSGKRSKEGMALIKQTGFRRVTCLSGGLQAWSTAGYPVEGIAP